MAQQCKDCQRRFEPWQDEEGRMHTCRQGCPEWEKHEAAKQANYERHIAHINGIATSISRERSHHRMTLQQKQGRRL